MELYGETPLQNVERMNKTDGWKSQDTVGTFNQGPWWCLF